MTFEEWAAKPEDEPGELVSLWRSYRHRPRRASRPHREDGREYALFGVTFYWILDPNLQSLEVFELTGGRYARAARATEGRMEQVPGCPALEIDLDELWAELSRLGPPEE